jgi:hypothetical protein
MGSVKNCIVYIVDRRRDSLRAEYKLSVRCICIWRSCDNLKITIAFMHRF